MKYLFIYLMINSYNLYLKIKKLYKYLQIMITMIYLNMVILNYLILTFTELELKDFNTDSNDKTRIKLRYYLKISNNYIDNSNSIFNQEIKFETLQDNLSKVIIKNTSETDNKELLSG